MARVIPLGELTFDDIKAIRETARATLRARAAEVLKVTEDEIVVRDLVVGDVAGAGDFVDLGVRTSQTAGQQFWAEDAADLIANRLSSILRATEKVPDNKFVGVFGFFDLTPSPDLISARFKRGSDTLDFWQVEQCYIYAEKPGGMIRGVVIYDQGDPIDIQMQFKTSSDKFVGLFSYIAERYGEQISKTT